MAQIQRIKRVKNENYSIISNEILRNINISTKSKGLWAIIMALPDSWDFSVRGLLKIVPEGKTAIYSMLKELINCGYVKREPRRNDGKIVAWDYCFYETLVTDTQLPENLEVENLEQGNLEQGNVPQLSTKEINSLPDELLNEFTTTTPLEIFREYFLHINLNDLQEGQINLICTDEVRFRKTLNYWKLKGYKASNVFGILDVYQNGVPNNEKNNGTRNNRPGTKNSKADDRTTDEVLADIGGTPLSVS